MGPLCRERGSEDRNRGVRQQTDEWAGLANRGEVRPEYGQEAL